MISLPRIRPVPVVVALSLAFGAVVTAFGVVRPLPERPLPPTRVLVESARLSLPSSPPVSGQIQSERIHRGDTLVALLGRMDVVDPGLVRFVSADSLAREMLDFRAGALVHAELDSLRRVRRLVYALGILDTPQGPVSRRLVIKRDAEGLLSAHEQNLDIAQGIAMRTATVESTLFGATSAAGIPDAVASQVADILGGEVDFYRDLRQGDRLEVIYETLTEPDSLGAPSSGKVLAMRFKNQNRALSAVRFERADGSAEYFDESGRSLRKTFLRYPIEFARISSRYTDSRLHPVLGRVRAHKGVDFAAPSGTQIRSTGDGVVEFIGRQRGYGKVIEIQHSGRFSTLYAHMRGFARHLRKGDRIEQGDVIGYVGSTGYATGPHLHYEFRIGEQQADPLAVTLPEAAPLAPSARSEFLTVAQAYAARFEKIGPLQLARFE